MNKIFLALLGFLIITRITVIAVIAIGVLQSSVVNSARLFADIVYELFGLTLLFRISVVKRTITVTQAL